MRSGEGAQRAIALEAREEAIIRTYWQVSNVLALIMGAALLLYWTWSQGHPAESNEESWRQARVLILGTAVS